MIFKEINPEEMRQIVRYILADCLNNTEIIQLEDKKLTRAEFGKFLDKHPIVRTIVLRSINPQIWAGQNLPATIMNVSDTFKVDAPTENKENSYSSMSYFEDKSTQSGFLRLSESDVEENKRNQKNFPKDIHLPFSGELSKRGR